MAPPLVSVIIPCFNRATVIPRAVGSALRQTHPALEVIVVDDASEDHEALTTALNAFGDSRISLIRHPVNQGGAAARNTGVQAATGDFIAFLDSDDEWLPTKLEKQLNRARQESESDWLIYCQSRVLTTRNSKRHESIMPDQALRAGERIGDYLFIERGWLPTPAMLLPRALALSVPFNSALRRHQDYDFLLRLEAAGCRFIMVPEPLVVVHWEDFHQSARGLNPAQSLAFLDHYKAFLSPRARSGFVFGQIVMRLLGEGRRQEALRHLLRRVPPWHLRAAQHACLLSALIFNDARIAQWLAQGKRWITRSDDAGAAGHGSR